jgi:hypothetical protein
MPAFIVIPFKPIGIHGNVTRKVAMTEAIKEVLETHHLAVQSKHESECTRNQYR